MAANSQANLEKHVAAAHLVGINALELDEAVRLARAVQRRSSEILAEEATRLLARPQPGMDETLAASAACGPDCGCGDASAASVLPVVEANAAADGCGPDCGCAVAPTESVTAPQLVAVAPAPPVAGACDCGCS